MPNQDQDTYNVTCRNGRGDAIGTVYKGTDWSEACTQGAAHMDACTHDGGIETVSVRKDYYGFAHVSGRWSRRRTARV